MPRAPIKNAQAFEKAFAVSRETRLRLETYHATLLHWQKTINLVSPNTLSDAWERHFADSAQLVSLAPKGVKSWVDLGSGAGFPGLVVAILLADEAHSDPAINSPIVTLIESDTRKAAFLREVARQVGVVVDILPVRIALAAERLKNTEACVVSARALAPLSKLLGLAAPFCGPDTLELYLKGREAETEVAEAHRDWTFSSTSIVSLTDPEARVLLVRRVPPVQ